MTVGTVTLVGAGPGDPGLLTLRGREALSQAEVVVYDRLIDPALLQWAQPGAELLDVGKEPGHHKVPQEEIGRLLLEKARAGRQVVRLKGGDPFLFGRGGEELALLREAGVPVQVVPGVPSALAVPAAAGIPVTHRGLSPSVHILTGHRQGGQPPALPFPALVQGGGTLVFLMAMGSLEYIQQGLLQAGMDPQTPAAVIQEGTTPRQRQVTAPLCRLPQAVAEEGLTHPAVLVIGPVCALGEQPSPALPLQGRRVIVTRPKDRVGALSGKLRALGAQVLEFPCIETQPLSPCPPLERALSRLSSYSWAVFTSAAGVEAVWAALAALGRDARAFAPVRLAAIGPGTGKALAAHGLRPDLVPPVYDSPHLAQALLEQSPEKPLLLLRSDLATRLLPQALSQGGVPWEEVACYRTVFTCPPGVEQARDWVREGAVAAFTSASTVRGFAAALGEELDYRHLTACCIGPQTERQARDLGLLTRTARTATLEGLVQCILEGA